MGFISSLACVHPGRPYEKDGDILYSDPRVLTIYELLIVSSLPLDWNIPSWARETFIRKVIGERYSFQNDNGYCRTTSKTIVIWH
jgi:hypothetical protein